MHPPALCLRTLGLTVQLTCLPCTRMSLVSCPPAHLLPIHCARRAALGLGGVLIVAAAVLGALGLCSWAGMRSTLIIAEVIPFLALAGG